MSKLQKIAQEAKKRKEAKSLDTLHEGQQRVFFQPDPFGEMKYAQQNCFSAHRRWGKTTGAILYLAWRARNYKRWMKEQGIKPHVYHAAYVERFRSTAKDKVWLMVKEMSKQHGWGCKFANDDLIVTFPNGGYFRLYGADDSRYSEDIRGHYWDDIIFDECQNFIFVDLEKLINEAIGAASDDYNGRVFLFGTPGLYHNYFRELNLGRAKLQNMWVVPEVKEFENPHTAKQMRAKLDRYQKALDADGAGINVRDLPWVQREYFGRWIADNRLQIIKLNPEINYLQEYDIRRPNTRFFLGIDFGIDSDSAYVVACEHPDEPWIVYLEAWTAEGMMRHDHAEKIKEYQAKYPNILITADAGGLGKPYCEELRTLDGLPVTDAEKKYKRAHIERVNSWASLGLLKIYNVQNPSRPDESPVARQWAECVKKWPKNKSQRTHPDEWEESDPHHIHDAGIYAAKLATAPAFFVEPDQIIDDEGTRMRKRRLQSIQSRRMGDDIYGYLD